MYFTICNFKCNAVSLKKSNNKVDDTHGTLILGKELLHEQCSTCVNPKICLHKIKDYILFSKNLIKNPIKYLFTLLPHPSLEFLK